MSLLTLQFSQTAVGHLEVRIIITTRKGVYRAPAAAEGASQLNETINGHFWPLALSVLCMLFRPDSSTFELFRPDLSTFELFRPDLSTFEPLEPSVTLFVLSPLDSSSFSSLLPVLVALTRDVATNKSQKSKKSNFRATQMQIPSIAGTAKLAAMASFLPTLRIFSGRFGASAETRINVPCLHGVLSGF